MKNKQSRNKQINYRSGFTLMEMVVYMGILSIFLLVMTTIFVSILDAQLESEATSSVNQDAKFIFARLLYDINQTETISQPSNPGETSDTLQISIDSLNYTYGLNGNDLMLDVNGQSNKINSFDTMVSDFSIRRLGNTNGKNNLQIGFTLTSIAERKNGPEIRNFQTTIGTR
ncbi:hypothetical protein A2Y99_02005 [Candidatus Gottesmanbacteria bacterium RBG_13_37_7]|uniref:Prepilin-type N-terminal cleavage/methylation domain-containing protein n=1 Tax=Candidatus Gottesmanbacteria bacterium RBG_13_37_7 TaxID=1798369 RepID=A0A1F5YI05_9BACT|nr:MAG: hypothetical protein A2Y99_02005 [Candidatus Gottesmanbacteria bacterium RBG_13_37_7]